MGLTRQATWGVFYNWVGKACAIAVAFVVTPIVVRGLGDEAYGVWQMVMALGTYYALANLGLRAAGVKYIAQFDAVGDHESVNRVAITTLAAYLPLSALVLALAGVVAVVVPFVPAIAQLEEVSLTTLRWVIVLTGLATSIGIVGQVFAAVLVAFKRFDQINLLGVFFDLIQAGLIVTAVRSGQGLLEMTWIILAVMVCRQLAVAFLATRAASYLTFAGRHFSWTTLRSLLKFGVLNIVAASARRVTHQAGPLIIGIIVGPAVVTFYSIAAVLASKVEDLAKGVNSVLMPVVSQLDAQQRPEELQEVFVLASRLLLTVAISLVVVFVALGKPLIGLWIGEKYAVASYPVLCLLAVGMAVRIPTTSAANVLKGTARMDRLAKVSIFEAVLTLVLGIVLVRSMGILGMAVAIICAQALSATVLVSTTCQSIGVSIPRYLARVTVPGIIASLPAIGLAPLLVRLAPQSHLVYVALQGVVLLMVTAAASFVFCLDEQLRTAILGRLLTTKPAARAESPRKI